MQSASYKFLLCGVVGKSFTRYLALVMILITLPEIAPWDKVYTPVNIANTFVWKEVGSVSTGNECSSTVLSFGTICVDI